MRQLLVLLFCLQAFMALPVAPSAWAEERENDPVVLEEERNLEVQELMAEEAVALADETHENILIRTKRGAEFEFSLMPTTASQWRIYDLMSEEQVHRFNENRIWYLRMAATVLDKAELTLGFGNLVKTRWLQFKKKVDIIEHPIEEIAKLDPTPGTIRERGIRVVGNILNGLDRYLWQQAPIVSELTEIKIHSSINPIAISGALARALGGITGLGIRFGFNREQRTTVFEIYSEMEELKEVYGPTLFAGVSFRLGISLQGRRGETDLTRGVVGSQFYPFIAPVYYFSSEDETSAGVEWFTFPPLISGLFQYRTRAIQKPLVRITFSKHRPGYFRMNLGLPTKLKSFCERLFTRRK